MERTLRESGRTIRLTRIAVLLDLASIEFEQLAKMPADDPPSEPSPRTLDGIADQLERLAARVAVWLS